MPATLAILVHPGRGPSTVRVSLNDATVTHTYGRSGQAEHHRTEVLADAETARRTFETRIFRLVSKGYRIGHHHPDLVEAIAKSPINPDSYHVYADWLAERNDPRAQLIAMTHEPRLSDELADVLVPHRWQLTRRDWTDYDVIWWMGFVQTVRLRRHWGWWSPLRNAEPDGDTFIVRGAWARSLLLSIRRHPSGRFLRWIQEEFHVKGGNWALRTFAVEFDLDVEPWLVRLIPNPPRGVNLNTASVQALAGLPGVGVTLAQHIVNRRSTLGDFESVDHLESVPGIGRMTITGLRDFVMV